MQAIGVAGLLLAQLLFWGNSSQRTFPPATSADGNNLVLNGYGIRELWWLDLYAVGLYLPQRNSNLSQINQPDMPKSIWIKLLYAGPRPKDLPRSLKRELFPVLTPSQEQALEAAYDTLKRGDLIRIVYTPEGGTQMFLNGKHVVTADHRVMERLLDRWIGPAPVSKDLRRLLLG
jgi:hypothetical protein